MNTTGNLTNEEDDGRIFDGKYMFKFQNVTSNTRFHITNDGMYF